MSAPQYKLQLKSQNFMHSLVFHIYLFTTLKIFIRGQVNGHDFQINAGLKQEGIRSTHTLTYFVTFFYFKSIYGNGS